MPPPPPPSSSSLTPTLLRAFRWSQRKLITYLSRELRTLCFNHTHVAHIFLIAMLNLYYKFAAIYVITVEFIARRRGSRYSCNHAFSAFKDRTVQKVVEASDVVIFSVKPQGYALLCVGFPSSDIEVETQDEDEDMSGLRGRGGSSRLLSIRRGHGSLSSGGTCSMPSTGGTQHENQPDNSAPTENSSAGSTSTIIKRRGVYKSINVESRTRFSKIKVQLSDKVVRPVGPGARDLANYCGLTMRTTISFRQCVKWEDAFKKYGEDILFKVKNKFEPAIAGQEEKFDMYLKIALQKAFNNWKSKLHDHYKKYASDEDRLANPPEQISPEDWEYLLTYFKSPQFQTVSARNKGNRAKQVTKHTCGCLSFTEVDYSVTDPTTGECPPLEELWQIKHTRKTADGQLQWSDPAAEEAYMQMRDLRQTQELQGDVQMTDDDILTSVLGQRSGYVRGKGYGAQPLRKRDRPQSSQTSIDQVPIQIQQDFEKKIQEEREKYEANLAAERAMMEEERATERAKLAKMEKEHMQWEQRMEQKMQAQFAAMMKNMQANPHP